MLTPPENGAGEFSGRKKCQHFQEKLGSRVVQVGKFHVHVFSATPNKKIQNHRDPPYKLGLEKACLLCPPPSSSLVMGSFSHGSPIVDIHMVKTRLGTGVPRSPESNAPILSLCPPSFPSQPTCSGYLQSTVHVLPLSLLLLPPPAAPPLVGPHNLVTSHLRLNPCNFQCQPLVNLWNMQITTSGAQTDLFFEFLGYLYPLGDL